MERTHWLCERCAGLGRWQGVTKVIRYVRAKIVNHIIPLAHGGSDEDENTENLCRECDLIVTAEQFGHRPRVTVGLDGWPV